MNKTLTANPYDGIRVDNVYFFIPDFVPGGEGNLWEKHRVSKFTFSPGAQDAATLTFTAPEDGSLVAPPVLVDALEDDDVTAAIYQNDTCVFGPITAKSDVRQGIATQLFHVHAGDRLRFEIKTLGADTTADWPVSLYYASSWKKEDVSYLPSEEAVLTRSAFFVALAQDLKLPCPHHKSTFSDVGEEDPCYNIVYELNKRGVFPPAMIQDQRIFPKQSINGYEAVSILIRLWESFRRPIPNAATVSEKAAALGLPLKNGALSPQAAKDLFIAFNEARKVPVGRTAHGEYSPVYGGIIREDLDIQKLIEDAYFAGKSEVTIPEGIYRVPLADLETSRLEKISHFCAASTMRPHLCLNGMKNFTVRGYGVTLLFQERPNIGVLIHSAENITFEGITLDYEPLVFTQGLITAINLEEQAIEFEIEDGYPCDFDDKEKFGTQIAGDFYKADGEISTTATSFSYPSTMLSQLGEKRYRLQHPNLIGLASGVVPGDYITFRGGRIANTFFVEETDGFSVTDCTVYTGNVGLSLSYGNATHRSYFTRYKNVPGPAPLGALVARLNSTSGTAYHCTGLRESFTATDCYVRNNGDDGTNIHGVFSRICEDLGDNTYVIATPNNMCYFEADDPLRFYDNAYGLLDEINIVSAEQMPEGYTTPIDLATNVGVWTFKANRYFKVKTDRPLRYEPGGWVTNVREICQGFVLKRCAFIGGRARGMLIKAGGTVEDCTIYRRPIGLMAAPEMQWLESDHVFGLTVKDTKITHCGFGRHPHLTYGATVHAYATTRNRDILFDHVTFADNYRIQLHIDKAENVTLKNCTFEPAANAYAHITVDRSDHVTFENLQQSEDLPVLIDQSADARFWSMHKKGHWE